MSSRRSLADALAMDPKKLEFIHGGNAAAKPDPAPVREVPVVEKPEPPKAKVAPAKREEPAEEPPKKAESKSAQEKSDDDEQEVDSAKQSAPKKSKERSRGAAESKPERQSSLAHATVPVTTRFRQPTAEALKRASLQRKLDGETPNTQQEIIELCVSSWLRSNGYLDARD